MPYYDYIIIGSGASGLLLADTMARDSFFNEKTILLLDKDQKKNNDRTWCFWEKGEGRFEDIVHKKWPKIYFAGKELNQSYSIAPYQYKMIRGIDFYDHYLSEVKRFSNITFIHEEVISLEENDDHALVGTKTNTYKTQQVFNSIFKYENLAQQQK